MFKNGFISEKERKKFMGWLLSGIMFGGVIGVFMTCIVSLWEGGATR